jgi:dipeptidase E
MAAKRLFLLSNSVQHGRGWFDHAEDDLKSFLGNTRRIAFVPYAAHDLDAYEAKVRDRFAAMGFEVNSFHRENQSLQRADAIFVGGGNTFRLLYWLYELKLLSLIRDAVSAGKPFIGSSAGSIVAGPTIKTTKDMPVLEPESFHSLALVDFQISPHYLDPDPTTTHMGETQEERIGHFLEENDARVVGLREGSTLRVENGSTTLLGPYPARLFQRSAAPFECPPGPLLWPSSQDNRVSATQGGPP